MHLDKQLILENLYSEYVNLPLYKKIFYPRKLTNALKEYSEDIYNKEKALKVCDII